VAPANFEYVADSSLKAAKADVTMSLASTLWRYDSYLPVERKYAISLGEGSTPLLPASSIGELLGVTSLFIKDESRNPTSSHKDRFSTVAVSIAQLNGVQVVATASSGNAGASLAAYARRAGMACVVATFGTSDSPMLIQIEKYGASVLSFADKAHRWSFLGEAAKNKGWMVMSPFHAPPVGSHPIGIEGYKTLAFEIVEQLEGRVPDWCVLPVCYGDALIGLWKGFKQLQHNRQIDRLPRLVAAEVHGSLSAILHEKTDKVTAIQNDFEALAISIGTTQSTFQALSALRQSNGLAVAIDNTPLVGMQELLAQTEGIFVELAAVTPFEALRRLRKNGVIAAGETVVCVATASGLKDVDRSFPSTVQATPISSVADAWRQLPSNLR
jgi:threonine synthase